MNVLIVPSWYPHRCFPREGIYVRDQAMMLGEMRPDWRIGLALWHQGRNFVSPSHARHSPRCLLEALTDHAIREEPLRENVCAWTIPALQFPERVLAGNRMAVLASVREAARRMAARFGPPDLLHAHVSYPGGWAAVRVARERGVKAIITEHMGPFPVLVYQRRDGTLADFIRDPLLAADGRIAVSPALAGAIAAHGIPRPLVVPNVVDERLYDAGQSGDPAYFTFYTVCQMVRSKGILDLLEAAALFLATLPPAERTRIRFRLAGKGPDLGRFQAAAERLRIAPHLTWIEKYIEREESNEEFARCDAFVLPSHHESFGIVFVEAMACGKPSIGTRCGGPESILTPETGVLLPVGDVPALADALGRMVRHAAHVDRARIRAEFERRFSRAAVSTALEVVYREVLEPRPPSTAAAGVAP